MWKISMILISFHLIGIDADSMRLEVKNLTTVKGVISCSEDDLQLCAQISSATISDICGKEFSYTDSTTKATVNTPWKKFHEIKCVKKTICGTKVETSNTSLYATFACTNLKNMNDVITCGCSYMDDTKKSLAPPGNSPSSEISQGTDEVGDPTVARQQIKDVTSIEGVITCTKEDLGLCSKVDQTLLLDVCGKEYTYTDNTTKATVTAPWNVYSKPLCMQSKYCGAVITTNNKMLYATIVCLNTKDTAVACGCRFVDLSRKKDRADQNGPAPNPDVKRQTELETVDFKGVIACTEQDPGPICAKLDKTFITTLCGPQYSYTDKITTDKVEAPWTEVGKPKCLANKYCATMISTAKKQQYAQVGCLNPKADSDQIQCKCRIMDETPQST